MRPPVTDNPAWPPTSANSPWAEIVDKDYFTDWEEPEFSWEEQIRQKKEKSYLPGWGKKAAK